MGILPSLIMGLAEIISGVGFGINRGQPNQ